MSERNINREKTNSITHLVKIVAQEVFDENIIRIEKAIKHDQEIMQSAVKEKTDNFLSNIKLGLENAYNIWESEESVLFNQEVKTALSIIARNHGRSYGAVRERLIKLVRGEAL